MTESLSRVMAEVKTLTPAEQQELRSLLEDLLERRTERALAAHSVLDDLLGLATELGVEDLAEQHDHYLYGLAKR